MARIYFDPDKDELVSTRKLTAKERASLQRMLDEDVDDFDDEFSDDAEILRIRAESARRRAEIDEETIRRMEDLEDAIRENTEAVRMNGLEAQARHDRDLDTAATIAGGIIGYKLTSDFIDGIADALNPFSGGSGCKKRWF